MAWLVDQLVRGSEKGETSSRTTEDTQTSTINKGARAVSRTSTKSGTSTKTEDAGGQVSFVINIKGGLDADGSAGDVCPTP